MDKLGAPGIDAEGQFLPETYRFVERHHAISSCCARRTPPAAASWRRRGRIAIPSVPLRSPEELLIMASIVEKESGLPQELPKIAGLYLHRLRIGMRLQADPTVIYGLGDRYDGELHTRRSAHRRAVQHLYAQRPAADADRAGRRRGHSRHRASGEDRCDVFRGLRPRMTAATCFPPRWRSTMPRSRAYVAHQRHKAARRSASPMSACAGALLDLRGNRGGGQDHAGGAPLASACASAASRTW